MVAFFIFRNMQKNEMSELPNGFFDGMKDIMKV